MSKEHICEIGLCVERARHDMITWPDGAQSYVCSRHGLAMESHKPMPCGCADSVLLATPTKGIAK